MLTVELHINRFIFILTIQENFVQILRYYWQIIIYPDDSDKILVTSAAHTHNRLHFRVLQIYLSGEFNRNSMCMIVRPSLIRWTKLCTFIMIMSARC